MDSQKETGGDARLNEEQDLNMRSENEDANAADRAHLEDGETATTDESGEAEASLEDLPAGDRLRTAREQKRLSLDHVAAETRIPIRHLETLESGHFDELPSRTYAIGFAKTYARAVGLDEERMADSVREEMGERGSRDASFGQGMEPGDPDKVPSNALAWFGGFAALILLIGVVAFASTYYGEGVGPQSLLVSEQSAADEGDTASAAEAAAVPPDADAEAAIGADGQVVFTALEDGVWVRFYEAEGERLFEAVMETGDTFEVPAEASEPLINTGRPDALSITIDGQEISKLAEEPETLGGAPVSASALLDRSDD